MKIRILQTMMVIFKSKLPMKPNNFAAGTRALTDDQAQRCPRFRLLIQIK